MDDIVKQALAKWPNVPHCYGWLGLDARGSWRMRDERAQAQGLLGERINHAALLGFINRNYTHDEKGRWYFQNGPQRVYINLEATPYIAHTEPQQGFVLHTGETLSGIDSVWLTAAGQLILQAADKVAQVDDRDMVQCMAQLQVAGRPATDHALLAWLADEAGSGALRFTYRDLNLPVARPTHDSLARQFGFVPAPQTDTI